MELGRFGFAAETAIWEGAVIWGANGRAAATARSAAKRVKVFFMLRNKLIPVGDEDVGFYSDGDREEMCGRKQITAGLGSHFAYILVQTMSLKRRFKKDSGTAKYQLVLRVYRVWTRGPSRV